MKKVSTLALAVWNILYPILLYWSVNLLAINIAQFVLGFDDAHYMLCQIIATLCTLPVVYFNLYRVDQKLHGYEKPHFYPYHIWMVMGIMLCMSFSLNNILCMSPLARISTGYAQVSRQFYGSTLALDLAGSVFLTPVLEELIYRGVIYRRLREQLSVRASVVLSALIFALFHFNWVQFIYAFFMGMILAYVLECSHSVVYSILGHMLANLLGVLRTELGILGDTLDGSVSAWLITFGVLLIGIAFLISYRKRELHE